MIKNRSVVKRKRLVGIILSLIVGICLIAQPMVAFAEGLTPTVDNSVDKSTTRVVGVLKLTGCTGSTDSFESGLTVYDSEKVKVDYSNPTNDYIQSLIDAAKEKTERLGQVAVDGHSGSCTLKPTETEKSESSYDNRVYTWVKDDESDDGILIGDPDSGAVGNQNRHMVITGDYARTTIYTVTVEVVFPDHVWGEGVVTQEPTETEEGIRTFTCAVCQKTRTEAIPKLDPTTYKVTFDMGGHGTAPADQTVNEGSKATKPAVDPTAEGWTFGGWYADATFSEIFNFETAINANTTIYAKWTKGQAVEPTDSDDADDDADTGDNSNMFLPVTLLILALLGAGAIIGLRRKEER